MDCKFFDLILEDLLKKLRYESELVVNESLVKTILGGFSKYGKSLISSMLSNKDCYIANLGYFDKFTNEVLLKAANVSQKQSFVLEDAINLLGVNDFTKRGLVIFVLDYDIQVSELFLTCLFSSSFEMIFNICSVCATWNFII